MTNPQPMTLHDYVRELTETHTHAEHYQIRRGQTWYGANHVTRVPPLLTQLWANDTPSNTTEEGPRPGFASSPAARLDALDTAARIDIQAHRWVTDLGATPRSLDTIDLIRQLHGLTASHPEARRDIERSVKSWWIQARIVTGWDSPAWNPDATCPQCGERGTLKIRLAESIGSCSHDACRATWDQGTIGLLADHIRAESSAERRPRERRGPCWCPWPEPVVADLSVLCPGCGSARCVHALMERLRRDAAQSERMGA